jgi:hypothetical protein
MIILVRHFVPYLQLFLFQYRLILSVLPLNPLIPVIPLIKPTPARTDKNQSKSVNPSTPLSFSAHSSSIGINSNSTEISSLKKPLINFSSTAWNNKKQNEEKQANQELTRENQRTNEKKRKIDHLNDELGVQMNQTETDADIPMNLVQNSELPSLTNSLNDNPSNDLNSHESTILISQAASQWDEVVHSQPDETTNQTSSLSIDYQGALERESQQSLEDQANEQSHVQDSDLPSSSTCSSSFTSFDSVYRAYKGTKDLQERYQILTEGLNNLVPGWNRPISPSAADYGIPLNPMGEGDIDPLAVDNYAASKPPHQIIQDENIKEFLDLFDEIDQQMQSFEQNLDSFRLLQEQSQSWEQELEFHALRVLDTMNYLPNYEQEIKDTLEYAAETARIWNGKVQLIEEDEVKCGGETQPWRDLQVNPIDLKDLEEKAKAQLEQWRTMVVKEVVEMSKGETPRLPREVYSVLEEEQWGNEGEIDNEAMHEREQQK